MLRYLPFLLVLALWIYAFIDVLNTPEKEVRNLPKLAWIFIVLLFGEVLLGPIAWFVAGRPRRTAAYGGGSGGGVFSGGGGRGGGWVAPDDNPDFLKSLGDETKREREKPAEPEPEPERAEPAEDDQKRDDRKKNDGKDDK
ncbi:PLD nuclease N-terminal domain-containing protein [Streptomyces sp. NPDC020875]|uniref:PLD nuclease N-terminal domain-containing protein n=1 Tax=Streptomyces sp. NPDC020875 TaxID=3154898 RepID=UPI0033C6BF37